MEDRDEATAPTKYVVGPNGIDYTVDGEVRRVEAGDVVDDLPAKSIPWLVKSGAVHVARIVLPADMTQSLDDAEQALKDGATLPVSSLPTARAK